MRVRYTKRFGESLENELGIRIEKFAYPDIPICQGTVSELEDRFNLSAEKIADRLLSVETVMVLCFTADLTLTETYAPLAEGAGETRVSFP